MRKNMFLFDSHAHIFKEIDGLNYLGKTSSGTDGKLWAGDSEMQFMCPGDGEETSTSFPAGRLIAEMDAAGVDKAMLLQNVTIGIRNEEILEASQKYAERLYPTFMIDPRDTEAVKKLKYFQNMTAHSALKLEISEDWGWSGIYADFSLDERNVMLICEQAVSDNRIIIIDPGVVDKRGYQPDALNKLVSEFPEAVFIIEHIGNYMKYYDNAPKLVERWKRMLEIAKRPNVYMGISAMSIHAGSEQRGLELLELVSRTIGADKLIWGSDAPSTMKYYSYVQMADFIINAPFLKIDEIAGIAGNTISRLLRIKNVPD